MNLYKIVHWLVSVTEAKLERDILRTKWGSMIRSSLP